MITRLIRNEFYLERKSSFNLLYISFFAISCLMFLLFSFPLSKIYDSTVFSGFFWIIISLSTIKLIGNSFAREKDYNIYDLIYSSTSKSFLFPVIFFPLIIPILINASNILFGIIIGEMSTLYVESWLILLTFALIGILLGINLFERLIKQ